jgi:polysaccharide deacetylase 2 family uncharacterized protein YibQ
MSRRKRKPKKTSSSYKYLIYILSSLILLLIGFLGGYYVGIMSPKPSHVEKTTDNNVIKKLEKIVKEETVTYKEPAVEPKPTESIDYSQVIKEYKKTEIQKKEPIKKVITSNNKPKVVIIIDDVSFKSQVHKIQNLPIKITPSFFPPSNKHPNTHIYAKKFDSYMIHLPLEAISFSKEEAKTLHIGDSYTKVENRIKELKSLFPNANFTNNHTGSRYTSSKNDMKKLITALHSYGIDFVDSKTTPYIVAPKIFKSMNKNLFVRDVFLDNEQDVDSIKYQLRRTVKLAKKNGFAIAIGHPHSATFKALSSSKNILKDVEVISIDELNSLYKNNKLSKL